MKNTMKFAVVGATLSILAGCSGMGGSSTGSDMNTSGQDASGPKSTALSSGSNVSSQSLANNPYGIEVDENGIPVERTIYFAFDSDRIDTKYSQLLQMHASYLNNHPDTTIVLQGHSDQRGTREYNLGLSERRANSIQKYLSIMNVSSQQVEVIAYGEEKPATRGNTPEDYAKNRRVILHY